MIENLFLLIETLFYRLEIYSEYERLQDHQQTESCWNIWDSARIYDQIRHFIGHSSTRIVPNLVFIIDLSKVYFKA